MNKRMKKKYTCLECAHYITDKCNEIDGRQCQGFRLCSKVCRRKAPGKKLRAALQEIATSKTAKIYTNLEDFFKEMEE